VVAELRVEGADKFGKLAKALRTTGDKELRKELYRGITRAVRPLTSAVKKGTPNYFPRRYALELRKSLRIKTRKRPVRDPGITLTVSAKTQRGKERNLAALNRGRLRHPLYGDRRHWFNQEVSPNWWDEPLLEDADQVREELVNVLDEIGKRLEKKL
jgi:hypothetical protein